MFRNMSFEGPRKLTDPKAMRAMAHPIRLALLEELTHAGTLTATEAGEHVGESPANASFHLRQLAKYGFVEEAEGGTGRRRPWRLSYTGLRWSDVQDDPEAARAARALSRVLQDRYFARAERALEESRALPTEWRRATGIHQMRLYLTADELAGLEAEFLRVMNDRFGERRTERPPGAERVEIL